MPNRQMKTKAKQIKRPKKDIKESNIGRVYIEID